VEVIPRVRPFADFTVAADDPPQSWRQPAAAAPACLHFSGLGLIGGRMIASAEALSDALAAGSIRRDEVLEGTGYFTAVIRDGSELVLATDLLGLEHLYVYGRDDRPAMVSNRLHALTAQMRRSGIATEVNLPFAATTLASHHPFFRQCHSHDLVVRGVSLLPVDSYLVLAEGNISRRRKPIFARLFEGGEDTPYAELIDRAADELCRSIAAVRESGLFDHVCAELSGGRDSRVVFGALVRLGCLAEVPLRAWDRPGTDDLAVALAIAARFGGRFWTGDGRTTYPLDAGTALALWRSLIAGMYHKMWASPWTTAGGNPRSLRMGGTCAGAFKGVWSRWLRAEIDGPQAPEDALCRVFDKLVPGLPAACRPPAFDAFRSCILGLPGETVGEKLDNHYLFFRNRTHFGMHALRALTSDMPWVPLASPSLLLASRKLPWALRREGRVMFDLLDRLKPKLNFLPFAGGRAWPEEFLKSSRHYERLRRAGRRAPSGDAYRLWHEANRMATQATKRIGEAGFTPAAFKALALSETRHAWDAICEAIPALPAILGPGCFEAVERLFAANPESKEWPVAASKVLSIADLVIDERA
jgi:hypothetical protein